MHELRRFIHESELPQSRQRIDHLLRTRQFDAIGELPGFTIVERAELRRPDEDCFGYVFGSEQLPLDAVQQVTETYTRVTVPNTADILLYYDHTAMIQHVGIALGRYTAVSKFNRSHVYAHPLYAVPTFYGSDIRAYRAPKQ